MAADEFKYDREAVNKHLRQSFTRSEIRRICFDLGVDYEEFSEGKSDLIIEFLAYLDRKGKLPLLFDWLENNKNEPVTLNHSYTRTQRRPTQTDRWFRHAFLLCACLIILLLIICYLLFPLPPQLSTIVLWLLVMVSLLGVALTIITVIQNLQPKKDAEDREHIEKKMSFLRGYKTADWNEIIIINIRRWKIQVRYAEHVDSIHDKVDSMADLDEEALELIPAQDDSSFYQDVDEVDFYADTYYIDFIEGSFYDLDSLDDPDSSVEP